MLYLPRGKTQNIICGDTNRTKGDGIAYDINGMEGIKLRGNDKKEFIG